MYSVSEIFTATEIEINDEAWLIDIARRVNEILEMPCNADKKDSHSAKIIAKDRAHSWANLEKLGQTVNNDHFFL